MNRISARATSSSSSDHGEPRPRETPRAARSVPARSAATAGLGSRRRAAEGPAQPRGASLAQLPAQILQQIGEDLPTGRDRVALAATSRELRAVLGEPIEGAKVGHEQIRALLDNLPRPTNFREHIAAVGTLAPELRGEALLEVARKMANNATAYASNGGVHGFGREFEAIDRLQQAIDALPATERPSGLAELPADIVKTMRDVGVRWVEQTIEAVTSIRSGERNKTQVLEDMNRWNSENGLRDFVRGWVHPSGGIYVNAAHPPQGIASLRRSAQPDHRAVVARFDEMLRARPPSLSSRQRKAAHEAYKRRPLKPAEQVLRQAADWRDVARHLRDGLGIDRAAHETHMEPDAVRHLMAPDGRLRDAEHLLRLAADLKPHQVDGFERLLAHLRAEVGQVPSAPPGDPTAVERARTPASTDPQRDPLPSEALHAPTSGALPHEREALAGRRLVFHERRVRAAAALLARHPAMPIERAAAAAGLRPGLMRFLLTDDRQLQGGRSLNRLAASLQTHQVRVLFDLIHHIGSTVAPTRAAAPVEPAGSPATVPWRTEAAQALMQRDATHSTQQAEEAFGLPPGTLEREGSAREVTVTAASRLPLPRAPRRPAAPDDADRKGKRKLP